MTFEGLILVVGMFAALLVFFLVIILFWVGLVYIFARILQTIYDVTAPLFRALYRPFTVVMAVLGIGYIFYIVLLFLSGQPVTTMKLFFAVICLLLLGGMGLIFTLRLIIKLWSSTPSPRYIGGRVDRPYGHYDPFKEQREQEEFEASNYASYMADVDARIAQNRADDIALQAEHESWVAVQIEKREAAEEYSRQVAQDREDRQNYWKSNDDE
jgi:hypothetical protein